MTRVIGDDLTVTGDLKKIAGTSTNDAAVGGDLYINSAAVGNVGAGDDDLMVYTVPANSLSANNMRIDFEAWGTFANNATAKTLKVKFGADSFTVLSSGGSLISWHVVGHIIRTGAATQDVFIKRDDNVSTTPGITISTATRTLSSANDLKLTGTGAADNDVVQEGFIVSWGDQNT